jgi:hypothetical protein
MDLLFFFTIETKRNSSLRLSRVRRTSWKEGMVGVKKSCEILNSKIWRFAGLPEVQTSAIYGIHTNKLEWKSSFKTLTDKHGTFKCTGCAQFVDRRLPSRGKKRFSVSSLFNNPDALQSNIQGCKHTYRKWPQNVGSSTCLHLRLIQGRLTEEKTLPKTTVIIVWISLSGISFIVSLRNDTKINLNGQEQSDQFYV